MPWGFSEYALGDRHARPTHRHRVQALDYSTILSLAMRIIDSAAPVRGGSKLDSSLYITPVILVSS